MLLEMQSSCTEQSFTTFATGCYCPSVPTSNDGLGITNVQLGTTDFPTTDVTYFSHAATTVTLPQGLNTNLQISFATGYTYNTYIWIDFNDNLTFEASEIVFYWRVFICKSNCFKCLLYICLQQQH